MNGFALSLGACNKVEPVASSAQTSLSSLLTDSSILETEEARLLRRSIVLSLSSLDSLARIRSTFSAKLSAIFN